jgi:hypothetical protein
LLCDTISVGRFVRAMTFAIVKVLPVPVAPSSTWWRWPPSIDWTSS